MAKYGKRKTDNGPGLNLSDAISLTVLSGPDVTLWAERLADPVQRQGRYTWPKAFTEFSVARSAAFKAHMSDVNFRKVTDIDEMIAILKQRR